MLLSVGLPCEQVWERVSEQAPSQQAKLPAAASVRLFQQALCPSQQPLPTPFGRLPSQKSSFSVGAPPSQCMDPAQHGTSLSRRPLRRHLSEQAPLSASTLLAGAPLLENCSQQTRLFASSSLSKHFFQNLPLWTSTPPS